MMQTATVQKRGFTAGQAATVARIAYHQVDHWAKTGLLTPSVRTATGSDTLRVYSFVDVVALRVIGELRNAGFTCEAATPVAKLLRKRGFNVDKGGFILGHADGSVEWVKSDELARVVREHGVTFAWVIDLGKIVTDVKDGSSRIERPTRGRASKVA